MAKNLTITVEEDVARWARIKAAEANTSVSRLVGEMLRERMAEEEAYAVAMTRFLSRPPVRLKEAGAYPDRDSVHDRSGLR